MTTNEPALLDPARLRELFDLRSDVYASRGGAFDGDPYPAFHALRESGPVHPGTPGELVGFTGPAFFSGLPYSDRPHFTVFDYATCNEIVRDGETFSASEHAPGSAAYEREQMLLFMDGARHRRHRTLVQSSFVPKRARWWIENWIDRTVHALIDTFAANGKADLNVEYFSAIPLLTICGSFGIGVADALDIRAAVTSDGQGMDLFNRLVTPIIRARREEPQDDLISVLVEAELDDDGVRHQLSDGEVLIFAYLLLAAGSGTTWKQLGITLLSLLDRPELLERVRREPELLRAVVEESLRWMPTDPAFGRFATRDVELHGVAIPRGAVVHVCFGAANRDPERWERPDEFDPDRPLQANLGFGGGPHICLGMHVARAEIRMAIAALLKRLPDLRLDPDAEPPRIIGMYERGPTSVPVVWRAS
ncbi:cytochrome P450 [Cryptosporangium aurantiacum]|uniref:Cytochrome P450 n=1 Tax=Cryptosporangium aurantiacum TaxID=134849 RepID=A0A1M7TYF3_9ACTN|nr:cytochrome P450 [Cryptosporangium aurantiacum]SHN75738.1 Cytochrome P450 [Cryptosporangium aurantiacum]